MRPRQGVLDPTVDHPQLLVWEGRPISVPGTTRPAPAVTGRAWAEMPTGRRRSAAASLSGTSSGQTGPPVPGDHPRGRRTPRTPILPLYPDPPAGAGGLVLCLRRAYFPAATTERACPARRRFPWVAARPGAA
jgi:hypothetical protein